MSATHLAHDDDDDDERREESLPIEALFLKVGIEGLKWPQQLCAKIIRICFNQESNSTRTATLCKDNQNLFQSRK